MTDPQHNKKPFPWRRAVVLIVVAGFLGNTLWSWPRKSWSLKDHFDSKAGLQKLREKNISLKGIRHILLISIDTLRADHMGCYGYSRNTTPNIDNLARESIVFNHAIAPVPTTLPSHCSMMTGTTPLYHNVHDNIMYHLGESNTTLAEILKKNGFSTEAIVAAYVLDKKGGLDQGFDRYDDRLGGSTNPLNQTNERKADKVTQLGIEAIRRLQNKKSFLFIHYYDPHSPYAAPVEYRYVTASTFVTHRDLYDSEIAYTDDCIGKLIGHLKQAGLYDSTLIILTSDHGESLKEHGEESHGFFTYHCTVHVPLMIKIPGLSEHVTINDIVGLIDIMPTVCGMLEVEPPLEVEGQNLMAYLSRTGSVKKNRILYSESLEPTKFFAHAIQTVTTDKYKYINTKRSELYDLVTDPTEKRNIIKRYPKTAQELKEQLTTLVSKTALDADNATTPDQESLKRLASLGYLAGNQGPTAASDQDKDDPKDIIESTIFYNKLIMCMLSQKYDKAKKYACKVIAALPDYNGSAVTDFAEILAIHPDLNIRDPKTALELAEHMAKLNEYSDVKSLNTLATAYAANGRYEYAVKMTEEAAKLPEAKEGNMARQIRERLNSYKQQKPYLKTPAKTSYHPLN